MKRNIIMSFIVLCLFSIILIGCGKKGYRSIKVFKTEGTVNVIRGKKTTEASKDMKLKNNDVVEVLASSSTVLKLDNDKFVMAKENTTLRLVASGKANNTKTRILVDKGGVIVEVKEKLKEKESFEIASSNSVMAIRGTQISFDVEVKDNKITTSFAILDGNTEILLLKNNKLSSTTLSKDFRMSYTTDLSEVKTVKDIAKLVDKTKPSKIEEVSDNDLATVFNAVKEELTTEEIDSIVDTINEFEREDKEKVNGTIKFKFNGTPEYKMDPKDYITIEEDWKDLVGLQYLYSKTIDGEYTEFDSNNPLEMGDWYCKIKAGNAYRSEPLAFSIGKIGVQVNLTNIYYDGSAYMKADITNEELVEFFKSDLAKTPADPEAEYNPSEYMYYIVVWYGDPGDSDGYKYPIYFDYENFGGFGTASQLGEAIEVGVDYNLPDYFDYKGEEDLFLYELEDYLDVKFVYAASGDTATITAVIDYYSTDGSDVKLVCMDGDLEMEPISFEINNGIGSADISITQGSFYFKIDGTDIKSETYSFDASNFTDGAGSSMSMDYPSNTIITYNEDDTINIYLDLGFNGANTYEYLLVNSYNDVLVGGATSLLRNQISTGNTSYLVMEDVKDTSYTPNFIGIVRIVDGLAYVASDRTGGQSGSINESTRYYGYINAADDAYYAESYQYFIKGTNIDFYDANGNHIISVAESDFQYEGNDYMFTTSLLDYEAADVSLYFTATVYGYIPQVINEELINDDGTFSDEVFAYVSNMLSENGVTIKGSNKHYVVMAKFN